MIIQEAMPVYQQSDSIKDLQATILSVQREAQTIGLDGNNPFFKSKYATYHQILQTLQPILSKNGIVVNFFILGVAELATTVYHVESEQFITTNQKLPLSKKDPQGVGASVTYMKRYSLISIFNLDVADIDDDGNTASGKQTRQLPGLTPKSQNWKKIATSVATGKLTIDKVMSSFSMNAAHKQEFDLLVKSLIK